MKKLFEIINKNLSFYNLIGFSTKPKVATILPLITIAREKGSGGRPIAYLVQKKLGDPWKVYHKEIVDQIAKETHQQKELIEEIDEKKINAVGRIIEEALGKRYPSLSTYYKHLVKILTTIGQRGNAIVVGRGVNFIFPNSLKIRIICDKDQRIKWMMQYEKISKKEAINRIEKSDQDRLLFIKEIYKHDVRKANHYDLIIKTGEKLSIDDAAKIIVLTAKKRFNF